MCAELDGLKVFAHCSDSLSICLQSTLFHIWLIVYYRFYSWHLISICYFSHVFNFCRWLSQLVWWRRLWATSSPWWRRNAKRRWHLQGPQRRRWVPQGSRVSLWSCGPRPRSTGMPLGSMSVTFNYPLSAIRRLRDMLHVKMNKWTVCSSKCWNGWNKMLWVLDQAIIAHSFSIRHKW